MVEPIGDAMSTINVPSSITANVAKDFVGRFVANVRGSLSERGMSQAELSAAIGMPRRRLNKKLTGRAPIYVDDVATITHALGIEIEKAFFPHRES